MNTIGMFRRGAALLAAMGGLVLAAPALADVTAAGAWTRATTPGARIGVGYMVLTNTGAEAQKLLRIVSPVADMVTLHRSSIDSQGMSRMWPMGGLTLQPGETVRLEPNGIHAMFDGLKAPFKVGDKVPLLLHFDGGQEPFTIELEVRPLVPAPPHVDPHR